MEENKNKKYELVYASSDSVTRNAPMYQIKALRDFGDVKAGDLGGFIEKEANLSHEGNCWVYDRGQVHDNAQVRGNAKIKDRAKIYDYAQIKGDVIVADCAKVMGESILDGDNIIGGHTIITDTENFIDSNISYDTFQNRTKAYANLYGDARVYNDAESPLVTIEDNELEKKLKRMQEYIDRLESRVYKLESKVYQ